MRARFSFVKRLKGIKVKFLPDISQKTSVKHFYFVNILCYNRNIFYKYCASAHYYKRQPRGIGKIEEVNIQYGNDGH